MGRFACIAVAHRSANAVGTVAWTFGPTGLALELDGVRPHVRGFAFGGEAQHATLVVPYSAIRGVVREGPILHVSFDPKVLFPYNRFALVRFARELGPEFRRAKRVAAALSLLGGVLPFAVALLAWVMQRHGLLRPSAAALGALASAVVGVLAVRLSRLRVLWGGANSDRLREEFEHALRQRLGLTPADVRIETVAEPPALVDTVTTLSRPRWVAPGIVVAVVGTLAMLGAIRKYGVVPFVRLPVSEARTGLNAATAPRLRAASLDVTPRAPACDCERADSPLWSEPPPKVALLAVPLRGELDRLWLRPGVVYSVNRGGRDPIEFDLAVVNGSTRPIKGLAMVVTLWRRAGSERKNLVERGLAWDGTLEPGGTVKWRVRGRGDALRVTSYVAKAAEEGPYAAPDDYARLLEAKLPVVRLYAATMLSYLGDPRASRAVKNLGVLSRLEEAQRTELLDAEAPLVACQVADGHACVLNRTSELVRSVTLADASGRTAKVDDLFFGHRGLRVPLPGGSPPVRVTPAELDSATP